MQWEWTAMTRNNHASERQIKAKRSDIASHNGFGDATLRLLSTCRVARRWNAVCVCAQGVCINDVYRAAVMCGVVQQQRCDGGVASSRSTVKVRISKRWRSKKVARSTKRVESTADTRA